MNNWMIYIYRREKVIFLRTMLANFAPIGKFSYDGLQKNYSLH